MKEPEPSEFVNATFADQFVVGAVSVRDSVEPNAVAFEMHLEEYSVPFAAVFDSVDRLDEVIDTILKFRSEAFPGKPYVYNASGEQ
jgi:hypothetical protein